MISSSFCGRLSGKFFLTTHINESLFQFLPLLLYLMFYHQFMVNIELQTYPYRFIHTTAYVVCECFLLEICYANKV